MKTMTFTWGIDNNTNLYKRDIKIDISFNKEDEEYTIAMFDGDGTELDRTETMCDDIEYYLENYISDSLGFITECDDKYIVGVNYNGDFVEQKDLVD